MKQSRILLTLFVLTLFAIVPAALRAEDDSERGNANHNPLVHEPILIYQQTGGNLTGAIFLELTVNSDGQVTLARQDRANPTGKVCTATVKADRLQELARDLRSAGALRLQDLASAPPPDVALTTVTVFACRGNSGNCSANTFSYYVPSGRYSQVEDLVQAFIAEVFPNC